MDQVVFSNERSASYGSPHPRHRRGQPPVVEGLGLRARVRRYVHDAHRRGPAVLLAAAAAERARGRAPVREARSLTTHISPAATATSTSSASARPAAGAGSARSATSCSWRWRRSCRRPAWSAIFGRNLLDDRRRRRLRCVARVPGPQALRMRGRGPRIARGDGRARAAPGMARGCAGRALRPRDRAAARRRSPCANRCCSPDDDTHSGRNSGARAHAFRALSLKADLAGQRSPCGDGARRAAPRCRIARAASERALTLFCSESEAAEAAALGDPAAGVFSMPPRRQAAVARSTSW
jgi:hypothetical protein